MSDAGRPNLLAGFKEFFSEAGLSERKVPP